MAAIGVNICWVRTVSSGIILSLLHNIHPQTLFAIFLASFNTIPSQLILHFDSGLLGRRTICDWHLRVPQHYIYDRFILLIDLFNFFAFRYLRTTNLHTRYFWHLYYSLLICIRGRCAGAGELEWRSSGVRVPMTAVLCLRTVSGQSSPQMNLNYRYDSKVSFHVLYMYPKISEKSERCENEMFLGSHPGE